MYVCVHVCVYTGTMYVQVQRQTMDLEILVGLTKVFCNHVPPVPSERELVCEQD